MKSQVNLSSNYSVGVHNLDNNIDVYDFFVFVKTSLNVNLETSNFQNTNFF